MSTTRTLLLAGNWKMNLDHLQAISTVQKLAWSLKDHRVDAEKTEVAVLPPFTDIRSVQTLIEGDKLPIVYGAQDLSAHDEGAFTGEVSGAFLAVGGVDDGEDVELSVDGVLGHGDRLLWLVVCVIYRAAMVSRMRRR